jgi:Dehydratase family
VLYGNLAPGGAMIKAFSVPSEMHVHTGPARVFYGDVDIERAVIEQAGLRLATAQCKSEDDVIAVARDEDAIIAQYATVGAKAISALTGAR